MTTSGNLASKTPGGFAKLAVVLGVFTLALLIGVVVTGAALLRSFQPPPEISQLRRALVEGLDMARESEVEVTLPAWLLALGRVGASMTDSDPRVTKALRSCKSGVLGVYQLADAPARDDALGLLKMADTRLCERGNWSRIVTVLDEAQLVAVYSLEEGKPSKKTMQVFVIVLDNNELVIAAVRASPRPLLELAADGCHRIQLKELRL